MAGDDHSADRASGIPVKSGIVFDIQRFSIHDGPGIRTTVFLKGCPLRCAWCHNPESQSAKPQLGFNEQLCKHCETCAEDESCPNGALELAGQEMIVEEVMKTVFADEPFYQDSGGLTISGGEPTMQTEFTAALLTAAKKHGIYTAIETCGYTAYTNLARLLPLTDLFLYDIKETNPIRHKQFTGVDNKRILENLTRLVQDGAAVTVRCPRIPGYNDRPEHWRILHRLTGKHGVPLEILPYNELWQAKHRKFRTPVSTAQ